MSWYSSIAGILASGKGVLEMLTKNKLSENDMETFPHVDRDVSVVAQYSAQLAGRGERSLWGAFVEGLNRLPRPIITLSILGFLLLAPLSPERFSATAQAYHLMPNGFWALLSVIISFYFSGRMQLKSQDFAVKKHQLQATKDLVQMKKEFRKLDCDLDKEESKIFDDITAVNDPIKNKVVEQWLDSKVIGK